MSDVLERFAARQDLKRQLGRDPTDRELRDEIAARGMREIHRQMLAHMNPRASARKPNWA